MNILLFMPGGVRKNFGGPSVLLSTIIVLRNVIPHAKFILMSSELADSTLDLKEYGLESVVVLPGIGIKNIFLMIKTFKKADIIIDLQGIIFTDKFGGSFFSKVFEGLHFLIGKSLRKIVVKFPCDMGSFNNLWNRLFAKIYLSMIDLIFARSNLTKQYLQEMHIRTRKPIYVSPDVAFVLPSFHVKKDGLITSEKERKKKLIGISTSHTITWFEQVKGNYVNVISEVVNYLIKEKDCHILLIPNEIYPGRYDDVYVAKCVFSKIENKSRVTILEKEFTARELKGMIGSCELLIASRYHSIIAALSQGVPVVAVSWQHKYPEVMKLVGLEKYVCDIKNLSFAETYKKINEAWENRETIRANILNRIPYIKEEVLNVGKIVKETLVYTHKKS